MNVQTYRPNDKQTNIDKHRQTYKLRIVVRLSGRRLPSLAWPPPAPRSFSPENPHLISLEPGRAGQQGQELSLTKPSLLQSAPFSPTPTRSPAVQQSRSLTLLQSRSLTLLQSRSSAVPPHPTRSLATTPSPAPSQKWLIVNERNDFKL